MSPSPTRGTDPEDTLVLGQIKAMRMSLETRMDSTSTKIDNLDKKLTSRINKHDKELKRMNKIIENNGKAMTDTNTEFAKLKDYVEKKADSLPALITKMVTEKLGPAPSARPGTRPRPLGDCPDLPGRTLSSVAKAKAYLMAQQSLDPALANPWGRP